MDDIEFLEVEDVIELHAHQIDTYGGEHGLRDAGPLDSAVNMPRAGFGGQYFHSDVFEMAAAYLFHTAKNHPFVDGNKRAAAAAAHAFLYLNGLELPRGCAAEFERTVLAIAEGTAGKLDAAAFFREHGKRAG